MKVLVVSATPWNVNNSFGNSYSNIFSGMDAQIEFANIYCAEGVVNDTIVKHAYRMTEKELLYNIKNRNNAVGRQVEIEPISGTGEHLGQRHQTILKWAKMLRWKVLYWVQESLWLFGKWKNDGLKEFVKTFDPDLIFVPVYGNVHMCQVDLFVKQLTNAPMLGYISDDNYTLQCFSLSPFFWIDRLYFRRYVKKVIDACERLYVISEVQKSDYDKIFKKDCRVLTKGYDFEKREEFPAPKKPYQLFYAGNIGVSRWKSLAKIGKAIEKINKDGKQMELTIYTPTPLTKKMEKQLNIPGCIRTAGRIPYAEVVKRQKQADILVHVEPTNLQHRYGPYHGFSTKLVDYMNVGKPILAYGVEWQASIAHLKQHDAALTATNEAELEALLKRICEDAQLLKEYGDKAWQCGKQYHNIKHFQAVLMDDFRRVIHENCTD